MSRQLVARFLMEPVTLKFIIDKMDQRTGSTTIVKIVQATVSDTTAVSGPPQDIMFVIGEVASHGEDCLVDVHELS